MLYIRKRGCQLMQVNTRLSQKLIELALGTATTQKFALAFKIVALYPHQQSTVNNQGNKRSIGWIP